VVVTSCSRAVGRGPGWCGRGRGEGARRACVVAADIAAGKLVEELVAGVVEGLHLKDFAAEIAELGEPVASVEREGGIDLVAQALARAGFRRRWRWRSVNPLGVLPMGNRNRRRAGRRRR